MYGLVNQGIKDLVISLSNKETWAQICQDANAPDEYISMHYYEDETTYRLVSAVSKKMNIPAEKILGEFGKYWVQYTAKEGYGPLMDLFGEDFKSCLKNLNHLHSRMGMTMPKLSPPSFIFTELSSTKFQIEYKSKRAGLSPMVNGLLEGLAAKYNTKVKISFNEVNERKLFTLEIVGQ